MWAYANSPSKSSTTAAYQLTIDHKSVMPASAKHLSTDAMELWDVMIALKPVYMQKCCLKTACKEFIHYQILNAEWCIWWMSHPYQFLLLSYPYFIMWTSATYLNQVTKTHHKIVILVNLIMTKKMIVANTVVLFSSPPTKVWCLLFSNEAFQLY